MKQNFKYITDNLPQRKNDGSVKELMSDEDWQLASKINQWISQESAHHRRVVIWVKRSCSAFEGDPGQKILLGSFDYFCAAATAILGSEGLPLTIENVKSILDSEPDCFNIRLRRVLRSEEIEKIEEIRN